MRTSLKYKYGVIPVPIYIGNSKCSLNCVYCPSLDNIPKSYIANEDTNRVIDINYDINKQVAYWKSNILQVYSGDKPVKLEVILLGGTFSDIANSDRKVIFKEIYDAFNGYESSSLDDAKSNNSQSSYRICILVIETRPDCINEVECNFLLEMGVSKVELGVQSLNDSVLKANNRPYNSATIDNSTKLLKQYGFKIGYHMMLNMYGSNFDIDRDVLSTLIYNANNIPDQLKIYPLTLLKDKFAQPEMWNLYNNNMWKPYSLNMIIDLLLYLKRQLPCHVRLQRIQRQFQDEDYFYSGTNLRQLVRKEMKQRNIVCHCIKCQEDKVAGIRIQNAEINVNEIEYSLKDVFIYCSYKNDLVGYLKLYIDKLPIIREIKVLGLSAPVGGQGNIQSHGIGDKLIAYAEKYSADRGFSSIKVNASPGVRNYFYKKQFILNNNLLQKEISHKMRYII